VSEEIKNEEAVTNEKVEEKTEDVSAEESVSEEETISEETSAEESTSEETTSEDEAKTAFKDRKKKKKDKKEEKIEELNDRLLRNMAEFENFRNRSEKEKSAMFEIGAKSVVEKILPVMDNFERGFQAVSDEEKESPFIKGFEAVYKQFATALEEIGVTPIEAVGKEFDPNLHNAVMHEEDESMGANMVSEELQKGYMYKDSVVRHSMVKVVN
jgi:molecular chaperone GrpE